MKQQNKEDREKKIKSSINSSIGTTSKRIVNLYGNVQREYIRAYTGNIDNNGNKIKGLKDISNSRVNVSDEFRNLAQQAGFSTEIYEVAKKNAREIKNNSNVRYTRTDNIGMVNDQRYDIVQIDLSGKINYDLNNKPINAEQMKVKILKTEDQMIKELEKCKSNVEILKNRGQVKEANKEIEKINQFKKYISDRDKYVKKELDSFANKLSGKEYAKYRENDVAISISKDHYDYVKDKLLKDVDELNKQGKELRKKGNIEEAIMKENKAKDIRKTVDLLKPNETDSSKSMKLRESPKKVIVKDVVKNAHEAGTKHAKRAAVMTGAISGVKNIKDVIDGDKEIGKAILDTSKDIAVSSLVSYGAASGGSLVKAGLAEASEKILNKYGEKALVKTASKTLNTVGNNIGVIVSAITEGTKSLDRYFSGEINEMELAVELGEKGTGIIASMVGATAGIAIGGVIGGTVGSIVPIIGTAVGAQVGAFIGEFVGSMVGYMIGTQLYQASAMILQRADIEAERRSRIIEFSEFAYKALNNERLKIERLMKEYYEERYYMFKNYFKSMDIAILNNNTEGIVKQLSEIAIAFEGTLQFKTFEEFDEFMLDDSTTLVL